MSAGAGFFAEEPADPAAAGDDSTDTDGVSEAGQESGEFDSRQRSGKERSVSAEAISRATDDQLTAGTAVGGAEDTGFVRPYAITGGRTRANHKLELETLVSTRADDTVDEPDQVEQRSIISECQNPRSVAEIASTLGVPIGVARVLISDAADAGLVTVHKTISGDEGAEEHLLLMERVLSGLRRL